MGGKGGYPASGREGKRSTGAMGGGQVTGNERADSLSGNENQLFKAETSIPKQEVTEHPF